MRRLFIGFLAFVGVIAIVLFIANFAFRGSIKGDIAIVKSLPSPDSKYTATLYTNMGGGAAGWCSFVVSINTTTSPFSAASEHDSRVSQVYRGRCSITPQVTWLSPENLQIALLDFNRTEWVSAEIKGADQSGQVSVTYLFTPNSSFKRDALKRAP